ncbi:single-stranded DNA-binding protein [Streptomyces sp. NRRL F-5630]|uniref:single-stranded DNA-binding protein n=1 Tax=Streptomyces sp. NRRL F-5630 TaxID=1463864 RepID=UPI003D752802
MNETMVTVAGNVATDLVFRETQGGAMARFRLAATARRWHREEQRWIDGHTNFFTVVAWRHLADNVSSSVAIGDPLVVHGRLRLRDEVYDGQRRLSAEIEAVSVGHDLARGTSAFRRPSRDDARSSAAATVIARERRYGPTSWGPTADLTGAADASGASTTGSGAAPGPGGAATREPARVGDVVDEMFLRGPASSGEEAGVLSGGTSGGGGGKEAPAPALPDSAPVAAAGAPGAQSPVQTQPEAQTPVRTQPQPRTRAAKRPVPWVTTPPAPDDERGAVTSSRCESTETPEGASSAAAEPGTAAAAPARTARRTVAKRRVRGTVGTPGAGVGAEAGTGVNVVTQADVGTGVREVVPVGASLGNPDAVPPF